MNEKLTNDFVDAGSIFTVTVMVVIYFDIQPYASNLFDLGIKVLAASIIYVMIRRQVLNAVEGDI